MKRHDDYLATSPQGEKKVKRAQTFVFCALGVFLFIRLFYFTKNNLRLDYILLLDHDLPLLSLSHHFKSSTTPQKAPRLQRNGPEWLSPFLRGLFITTRLATGATPRTEKGGKWKDSRRVETRLEPVVCFFFQPIFFYSLLMIFFCYWQFFYYEDDLPPPPPLTAASSLPPFTPTTTSTHRTTHGL